MTNRELHYPTFSRAPPYRFLSLQQGTRVVNVDDPSKVRWRLEWAEYLTNQSGEAITTQ